MLFLAETFKMLMSIPVGLLMRAFIDFRHKSA